MTVVTEQRAERATEDETTDEPEQVVRAEGLVKTFGETTAVDGVSATVGGGEVFALVGPNGAGKTTFVRCLTGTVVPDAGSVELFGVPTDAVDADQIGVLPQSFSPQGRLTPHEIVSYHAGLYEQARDPATVLREVGLAPDRETFYENLSGGEKRRVAVGTTLVNDPDLIFLDEPTTAVDPAGRHRLWDLFESIAADGTTIVLTTHDMAEAERLADRVGLLAKGRLVATGAPKDVVAEHGGPTRLVVETDDRSADLPAFETTRTDDGLVVKNIEPTKIGDVVRSLDASGVDFDALSWREPTLEDAYLALVDDAGSDTEWTR